MLGPLGGLAALSGGVLGVRRWLGRTALYEPRLVAIQHQANWNEGKAREQHASGSLKLCITGGWYSRALASKEQLNVSRIEQEPG